jgi:hypothetical protein
MGSGTVVIGVDPAELAAGHAIDLGDVLLVLMSPTKPSSCPKTFTGSWQLRRKGPAGAGPSLSNRDKPRNGGGRVAVTQVPLRNEPALDLLRRVPDIAAQNLPKSDSRGNLRSDDAADTEQNSVCHQWAATMRNWPIRQIETRVPLSVVQHAALYELTGEMYRAAAGLIASCPRDQRFTPLGRIDVEQSQLKALRQSMDKIQPLLTNFERVLNDRQKIGLEAVVNASSGP